jgi:hypothetical protein
MPSVDLAKEDFGSKVNNVPDVKVRNMYVVDNPLSLSGVSYIPRPTLKTFAQISNASIRGLWSQSRHNKTVLYAVAGTTLYEVTEDGYALALGTIPGENDCTFASTIYQVAICSDGALFLYSDNVLINVVIPDNQKITDVTSLDNYLIVGVEGQNKFYWINPGEVSIDPLSFTSAERSPDDVVSVATIGDELWVLGQESTEVFADTGDIDNPFTRIAGRAYPLGCLNKLSVVKTVFNSQPCLIWITPSREVILAQGSTVKISNESTEELLKGSTTITGWSFRTNKHDFYVLTTDIATIVYDLTKKTWYRWSSYGQPFWDAVKGVQIDDTVYCASSAPGSILTLDHSNTDYSNDYLICEVSGNLLYSGRALLPCNRVTLYLNMGFSKSYLEAPLVELRWSDDGGQTWSGYVQKTLGVQGVYDTNVDYRSLGLIKSPGRLFEIRFSEIQSFRLDAVSYND